MNLRLRDQSFCSPPHQHQNPHRHRPRHRHEQRVLKICLHIILLLAISWISPTVLGSSSSSTSSHPHPHPHPHPRPHEIEPHETLSPSSSREGNKEEQIKNSLPWINSHFTFTNPSVLSISQSQSKSPGSSSLSTSSVPATSILSSWPLSLQPTFFSLLSSSSSSSSASSSPSATLNKDSKARSTFSMVGPGGEDGDEGDDSGEDGLSPPLSLAPYLSYPYTLALHNRGVNANANANANDLQSTVGSHSHRDRDRDRNWKQQKQSDIFTVLQEEDKLQRHHRDLSTPSSSSSSSLSSFPWSQNQNLSQDRDQNQSQNQRNRIIIPNSIPTLNQIQNEEKFSPIPSTSLILTDEDETSLKANSNGNETSTKDWSLQFSEYALCRYYEDYPPLVFQLHSCASCYMYMRDEISLFGIPSKKIQNRNVVNIPYLHPVWGSKNFKAFNVNGTIISANISDSENLLYKTFANQNAKQKWVDCCLAAQECCEKYQTTKDPQQRNSSTSIAKLPEVSEQTCQPTWDGWQCWGKTAAEMQATATCPPYIYFMSEPPSCLITITKDCDREGDWLKKNTSGRMVPWTNYATCASAVVMVQQKRAHVHVMAYAVSIIALIPALIVFFVYKQLRVHRIILHQNLFFSMLINGLLVIAFKTIVILNELSTSDRTGPSIINQNGIGCRLLFILTKYSRMTNYMWMFCEGYYLHRLIAAAFAEQKSLLVFYLLGWVFPILPTAVYAGLRMYDANDRCWVVPEEAYEWVLNIPSLLSLLINLGFLINIIRVLVTKLRAATTSNEPSQYRKAVRATLVLLPLFGLHFVVTIYRPPSSSGSCEWIELYYYVNYVLDGLQGFLVALIFCYVNGEVVALFKRTYSRWKEQHSAGCERQPSRLNNRNGRGRSVVSTHYSSVPESPEPGSLTRLTITNTELNGAVAETERLKKSCLMVNGKSNLHSHTILVTNVQDDDNDTNGRGDWSEIKLDVGGSEADNNRLEMTQAFTLYPNLTSSSALTSSASAGSPTSAASIRASNNRVKNGASVSSEHQL